MFSIRDRIVFFTQTLSVEVRVREFCFFLETFTFGWVFFNLNAFKPILSIWEHKVTRALANRIKKAVVFTRFYYGAAWHKTNFLEMTNKLQLNILRHTLEPIVMHKMWYFVNVCRWIVVLFEAFVNDVSWDTNHLCTFAFGNSETWSKFLIWNAFIIPKRLFENHFCEFCFVHSFIWKIGDKGFLWDLWAFIIIDVSKLFSSFESFVSPCLPLIPYIM